MQRARRHPIIFTLRYVFVVLMFFCVTITELSGQTEPIEEIIRYRIDALQMMGYLDIGEAHIASTSMLPELYEKNQFFPIWTDFRQIDAFIALIGTIDADGLEPEDYHYSEIRGLQAFLEGSDHTNNMILADLDMLLSDALILLENHLTFGKVDPHRLDPNWNFMPKVDCFDPLSTAKELIASKDLKTRLEDLKPQKPIYAKLKTALARYRSISAMGGWRSVPAGTPLKKNMRDERVVYLRQRVSVTGNLSISVKDESLFDDELEKAVIQFQTRHGLIPDGIVGGKTITALNIPVEKRIDQIRANLERARWCLHALENRFVLVDIAGFRIFFYDDDNIIWSALVQVGRPFRKTPVFRGTIRYLELNPSWTIPPMITREDLLPEIKKDPQYLSRNQINILDQRGRIIDPGTIDWHQYPTLNFPYTLRQSPGPHNALGVVKFMFPNPQMVYLHDTPAKDLFLTENRTYSSGCIRVQDPLKLAELLLDNPKQWNQDRFQKIIASGKSRVVHLDKPVPVLLLYWTVDVDNNGIVYFKEDIYARDAAVIKGLKTDMPAAIFPQ